MARSARTRAERAWRIPRRSARAIAALAQIITKLNPNGPVTSPICNKSGTSRCEFASLQGNRFGKKNSSVTQRSTG